MEQKARLGERLLAVQARLKAPKGQYNSFGKYKYRSCEDILEAVKPLLAEYGLVLTITDSIENIGGRFYVRALASLHDAEDPGVMLSTCAYAREDETKKGMDGSQVTGAASSYARKYALNGLFLIDDTKDADATNTHGKEPAARQARPQDPVIGPDQWDELVTAFNRAAAALNATSGEERNVLWTAAQESTGVNFVPNQMTVSGLRAALEWFERSAPAAQG